MGRKREREAGEMDEERIDIARRFLVASPPGEVGNVARDVRALLGGDALLSDARAQSIFRELNLKHFTAVDMPNGSKALLTPYGEVSSALSQGEEGGMCRHYLEPESGTIIEVDHVKQTCIGQRDAEEGEATSDAARALRSEGDPRGEDDHQLLRWRVWRSPDEGRQGPGAAHRAAARVLQGQVHRPYLLHQEEREDRLPRHH